MIHDQPHHRTDFMVSLYRQYADELREVREQQRAFYPRLSMPMFDDIEGEWLYLLVRYLGIQGPVSALEVGSGTGMSTSWMLRALQDNISTGFLESFDMRIDTERFLSKEFHTCWLFKKQNVMQCRDSLLQKYDFMLIDSDHNSPECDILLHEMLPRARPGGFACVHDIYMLPTPRQGEAIAMFHYLDTIGVRPFTPSQCFPENFQEIQKVRQELQLGANIHFSEVNSLLLFQVP